MWLFTKFIQMWCVFALVVLGLLGNWSTAFPSSTNVCETPACISAADNIRQRLNPLVDPCVDFYEFACGTFLNETDIPSDKTMLIPALMDIEDKVHLELLELIVEPVFANDTQPIAMAKRYYRDCMDHAKRQEVGSAPLVDMIRRIGGWPMLDDSPGEEPIRNWWEIAAAYTSAGVKGDHLVGVRVDVDFRNPMNRSIYLSPPDFTGSELMFFNDQLIQGIAKEFNVVDEEQLMEDMEDMKTFFRSLAMIKGPPKMYNPHSISDLQALYPYVDWVNYLNDILPNTVRVDSSERVFVQYPEYFQKLGGVLANTTSRTIASYFGLKFATKSLQLLDDDFASLDQNLNAVVFGISKALPARENCLRTTKENIPVILDAMYVRKYKNAESRVAIGDLLQMVREQMSANLWSEVQWMDAVTKHRAQKKINAIRQVIAYPDELLSDEKLEEVYRGLDLSGMGFFEATLKLKNFTANRALEKLRKSTNNQVDWSVLAMSSDANAFFDYKKNIIVIPAATLQGHLFSVDRPTYLNYAAIGTIIGHEINHGFDMMGRQFDDRGTLTDWWEPETETLFQDRAKCFVSQYKNFIEPLTYKPLNAAVTQSEDIADNGGVHLLYKTYKHWVSENGPEAKLPGLAYTAEQLFWIYYGQTWCGKERPEYLFFKTLSDPHSRYRFRVLGPLSNSEAFARDFHCPTGSAMNPETKCSIW